MSIIEALNGITPEQFGAFVTFIVLAVGGSLRIWKSLSGWIKPDAQDSTKVIQKLIEITADYQERLDNLEKQCLAKDQIIADRDAEIAQLRHDIQVLRESFTR